MSTKFLVTGGAGFIGSHLVERILREQHKAVVLDDFSSGRPENLAGFEGPGLTVIKGDVRDHAVTSKAMRGVEFVIHLAAVPSVARSIKDPIHSNDVNVGGTLSVLESARRHKSVRRVVFASSSSVYGDTPTLPKVESMSPQPISPYATSKLAAEQYCRAYKESYGLETVALRYFNVFGPRQDPSSEYAAVVPKFVTWLLGRKKPIVYGDGKQTRDFTFVENVVEANLRACEAPKVAGEVLNVATGSRVTITGLANMIGECVGYTPEPRYRDARSGEVRHSLADVSRAEDLLGYRPRVTLLDGLRRTVDWYSENR